MDTPVKLEKAVQIGIVVKDLDRTTALLSSLFGIGPFRFIEWPNRPDSKYWYRGQEEQIRIRQAFVQMGNLELNSFNRSRGIATPIVNFWSATAAASITYFSK